MVARSPPNRQRKPSAPPISPGFLRETVKKVDKCVARLEELQSTVKGFNLSPIPQNRNVSNLALRCRPEPDENHEFFTAISSCKECCSDDWQKMSLPAMLLGETMGEILRANQVAKKAVETISSNSSKPPTNDDPKTPLLKKFDPTPQPSSSHLKRTREKQQKRRGGSNTPSNHISKSRINFKAVSPECCNKENCKYLANRISPKNRPWVKKSVLFPNPLFHDQKFCKTKSPIIGRKQQQQRTSAAATPHKFLVKSSPAKRQQQQQNTSPHKFQLKIRISPTRSSPAVKRRSFSPSALAKRLVSPLKCRNSVQNKSGDVRLQRPRGFSPRRI
ncbi:hypothetical protein M569_02498 [Genlisea aurea]|uniref:Uncharacterized protein n=1 Tax=Genlisea aurea TaxID=192259 RepID=S8CZ27_9LAMI|nr:hypothetical protein M569_02498 [Genlisea aurea]